MKYPLDKIVGNIINGEKWAYDILFKEYYTPLVLFSMRFVNYKEVAEDIVQDFLCSLWMDRKKLKSVKYLKTYLYSSVKNRSLNYLRDNNIISSTDFVEEYDEHTTLEAIMEEEIYKELIAAIDALPPKCKQIFLLNIEGLKSPEIAEDLGLSVETVRVQVKKARRIIKENISNLLSLFFI